MDKGLLQSLHRLKFKELLLISATILGFALSYIFYNAFKAEIGPHLDSQTLGYVAFSMPLAAYSLISFALTVAIRFLFPLWTLTLVKNAAQKVSSRLIGVVGKITELKPNKAVDEDSIKIMNDGFTDAQKYFSGQVTKREKDITTIKNGSEEWYEESAHLYLAVLVLKFALMVGAALIAIQAGGIAGWAVVALTFILVHWNFFATTFRYGLLVFSILRALFVIYVLILAAHLSIKTLSVGGKSQWLSKLLSRASLFLMEKPKSKKVA